MKLNYNRKLLQEQNPFHYTTLTYSPAPLINDSSSSSTAAAEVSQPFKPNSSPFDTSMALTILVLLTALFFMSFFSFYIRRYADDASTTTGRSSTNNAVHHPSRRNSTPLNSQFAKGLDPSLIQSLPTICYGGDAKHRMECSICLTEFEETETVKLIPHCRHAFHPPCIDTWLASHESCPLCRSTELFDEVGVGSNVVEDNNGDGVGGRSTDGDEWRREVGTVVGVRRTCSYSSIRDRLSLPRSNSF